MNETIGFTTLEPQVELKMNETIGFTTLEPQVELKTNKNNST